LGYYIDFAIVDRKIAIEIDGHDYHKTKEQRTHDAERDRALDLDGWRVIRFTGSEVKKDAIGCARRATIEGSSNQNPTKKKSRDEKFRGLYQIAKKINNIQFGEGSIDDELLQINYKETQNLYDKALVLSNEEKYEDSVEILKTLINKNPSFIYAYSTLGCELNELGRYEEAIGYLEIALKRNHSDEIAWANKGIALSGLERHEEAIRCYDEALRIRNSYGFALHLKGIALYNLGCIDESIECLDAITKRNPELQSNAPVWYDKGNICFELQRYKDAIDCYKRSIELDPEDPIVWNNKGKTHYKMDQCREANACYDNAIQLDPSFEEAWLNKGKALKKLKIMDEAESAFKKAKDLKIRK
jgi:tetratricopeptide (TPR) repeat protein